MQSIKRKTLKTKRLTLRPYRLQDHKPWFDAYVYRLEKQNRFDLGPLDPKRCSLANFKKLSKRHEDLSKSDSTYIYGVFENKTGFLVGTIDIFVLTRSDYQCGNLGYRIHNKYWGKGFGKEAALAGLKIGFMHLGLNRLEAAINLDNKSSVAVAKAIGMRKEGVKARYLYENGCWTDHIVFSANPEDIGLKAKKPTHRI